MNLNSHNNDKEKAGVKRYLLEVGFITGNVFMKLFFCALFLRIFRFSGDRSRGRRMRTIIKVVTMVTILAGLGFIFGVVWQCIPIQGVWKLDGGRRMEGGRIEGTRCLNPKVFFYSFGVFDVLMDLIVSRDFDHYSPPPSSPPMPVMTGILFSVAS